ncbi:hypothetical protein PoB_005604800 [Plakobranchus ocellatus]|uniref:Secreted protein n=1 Tax=Plakobranchus ocellatus TaxID=259542 RepID=A0AAV4CCE7_9GAST|nr:hypothetical protein PoB_005604800 [Plakobranchus ocellatus]
MKGRCVLWVLDVIAWGEGWRAAKRQVYQHQELGEQRWSKREQKRKIGRKKGEGVCRLSQPYTSGHWCRLPSAHHSHTCLVTDVVCPAPSTHHSHTRLVTDVACPAPIKAIHIWSLMSPAQRPSQPYTFVSLISLGQRSSQPYTSGHWCCLPSAHHSHTRLVPDVACPAPSAHHSHTRLVPDVACPAPSAHHSHTRPVGSTFY